MTNWEKHKDDLLKISVLSGIFAVVNGKVKSCIETECNDCDFKQANEFKNCNVSRGRWLNEEYVEPPTVDWSKVPVDTKIYVKNKDGGEWIPRYFAKYENGKVYAFLVGSTSFSRPSEPGVYECDYAKLAEEE